MYTVFANTCEFWSSHVGYDNFISRILVLFISYIIFLLAEFVKVTAY